jgi:hypothetical protein
MFTAEKERLLAYRQITETGCWVGSMCRDSDGYAVFYLAGLARKAHRAAYIMFVGPIPKDRQLHHTCHNRACWNPEHLVCVTVKQHHVIEPRPHPKLGPREFCHKGHRMTEETTWKCRYGRFCRICQSERLSRQYRERKASR